MCRADPTEGTLLIVARKASLVPDPAAYPARLDSIPFDLQHQYMATLHSDGIVYVKGAAEILLERCAGALDPSGRVAECGSEVFRQTMEQMASKACAYWLSPERRSPERSLSTLTIFKT